jgi:ABC-type multidrug transport system fused ATPase/permease subunit
MNSLKKILFLFNEKEKNFFIILSILVFFSIFLEMLSLAVIVPVFNIIFVERSSWTSLLIIDDNDLFRSVNFKILVLVSLILIYLIKNIFLIILNFFLLKFFSLFQERISNELFLQHLNSDNDVIYNHNSQTLLRKVVQDSEGLRIYLVACQNLAIEILFLFFLFLLLMFYNYKITIFFSLIFFIVIFLYIKLLKKKLNILSKDYQNNLGEINNTVIEGVKGIKDIIVYNLKETFFSYFSTINKKKILAEFIINLINSIQRFWMEIIAILAVIIPLIIYMLFGKSIVELIPIFALFTASLFRVLPGFNRLILHFNNLKFYKPSFDLIYNNFFSSNLSEKFLSNKNNFSFNKSVALKNISFFYKDKSENIINDVNITFFKGECYILLGDNGSGKSTILNIVSGLFQPNNGKVLIDEDIDINTSRSGWLKKISYVQQDVFLLNKTIKENITLNFNNSYNIEKYNLIKKILLLDSAFQGGDENSKLDSVVGVAGSTLSGGQRQLISIARALYKDADIFLFDEPSSALDLDYQKILKNVITYLKSNNKTIIIITHDLYLFKEFSDKIYKIESGKIIHNS